MADTNAPSGPDLSQGVPANSLAPGQMLTGQVDGEAVLLARVGDEFFAVGATCTHYGGPLGEGLLVGDTVRCPWHHACFNLRSGTVARPPALADLPRWRVERRGDRVVVAEKLPAPDRPAPSSGGSSMIIVGAGAAGTVAADTLRREGFAGRIYLIDPDEGAPYDRPNLSKDYLAGTAPEEWIPLHPSALEDTGGVERLRQRVERIDPAARRVTLDDGRELAYEALLLATGATPVTLDIPVRDGARMHYLRSLRDSRAIIAAADGARRAVVLGASFIGLEVAASLRHRGVEVDVVAPDELPLGRVMGPELGRFIQALHQKQGVRFHLGRTAREIGPKVVLDDGTTLAADLVVAGVGVRPDLALAERTGLALDRGVQVNEFLETSATGIYAAGDIARWPDPHSGDRIRVEHWVVAQRQGQVAARNMLGRGERFAAVPFFWSQHYDVVIAYVGHAERWDAAEVDGDPAARDCRVTYLREGRRLAVATIFRDVESLEAELAMERAVG